MQPHTPRRPSTSPRIGGHPSSSSSEPNPRRPSYPGTSSPAVRRLPTPPAPSTPPHSQPTPLPSTPQPTIANATLPLQITPKHSTPPPPQNSTPQINSTPLSPPQTSSLSIPTHLKASRESRITLPDEASRYIANMVDTPTGSPAADKSTHNISSIPEEQQRNTQSPVVDDREPEPQAGKANGLGLSTLPNGSPPHITADDASSIDFSSDTEDATISSPPSSQTIPVINAPTDPDPPSSRRVNGRNAGYRGSMMVALSDAEAINKAVAANSPPNGIALSSSPSTTTLASSSASVSAHPTPKSQSNVSLPISTSDQSTNAAAYTYRSTRLTPPDLPHTVITVEGSHIRPNDRGKEVLSFVISVTIRDKEPYSVEKLYSDVLTLDARIKSLLSRTLVKKLGILPDNKLFKDNAPSKVDQRKVCFPDHL
jgi:RalA-binding protein 1